MGGGGGVVGDWPKSFAPVVGLLQSHNGKSPPFPRRGVVGLCIDRCIIARIFVQFGNNCTSNSRVIARGEAECNFDCYAYNSSQIVRKCGRLSIQNPF